PMLRLSLIVTALATTGPQNPPAQTWWAFQLPTKPPVIVVENRKSKIENPIDAFLLAKLKEKGLDFAPKADHRMLIRRIHFDITGLPPKPEELDEPYEKAVDRLLPSP